MIVGNENTARILAGAIFLATLLPCAAWGVEAFRAKMEKWVETRQLISRERSDWEADRETLRATRDLLKQQKSALESSIQELETASSQDDEERRTLLLRRAELQESRPVVAERVRAMELEARDLAGRLPAPLVRKLEPLLVQIPDDPEHTGVGLGQRLMNVLGILAQAEKWNGTANLAGETRDMGNGEKLHVRTLYWGLGQAIYVDERGEHAGIGRPGEEGWEFSAQPEIADDADLLLDIYEGNVDTIEFVQLPVRIQ